MQNNSSYQLSVVGHQLLDGPKTEDRKPKTENRQTGFSIIELVLAIGFLGLLVLSVIFAVNPLERAKVEADSQLKDRAENLLGAINQFYVAEGRLPWADDLGSSSPLPWLPWTSAFSPEVGICADEGCTTGGELITTNKLSPGAVSEFKGEVNIDKIYAKLKTSSPFFVAKGREPKDPVHACYLPQSEALRRATGKLYRITPGASIPVSGVPEDCPLTVSWQGEDICWACVAK